jgi:hypothetical protein
VAATSRNCISTILVPCSALFFSPLTHWVLTMALLSVLKSFPLVVSLSLSLLPAHTVCTASFSISGISVSLNGIPYLISPYSRGKVPNNPPGISGSVQVGGLYPMTLLPDFSSSNFAALVESFTKKDDVFQPGFLQSTLACIHH